MQKLKEIDRDDYKPLYAQLAERILEYIDENNMKPGDSLPSQNELIDHYGVSQITVRIAMQRLETDGIVKRIRGKGTFVAEKKIKEHIKGVRSFEDRLSEKGFDITNQFVESYEALPADRIRNDLNLSEGSQTFKIRRLKILKDTNLALETRHFPIEVASRFKQEELKNEPFVRLLGRHPDLEICKIVYSTRASLTSEMEAEMLGVQAGRPVLVQYGVFYNRKDHPVMAGRITYLAEKIELQYEVSHQDRQQFKILK